jgi:putative membrane protein
MKRWMIYGACLAIALAAPVGAWADLARGDASFMKKVAEANKAEVELGKLASERGSSEAVKKFAQRMVTDHGKASDELGRLAESKGVQLPTSLDAKHKRLHDKLAKLSGADFDREYMREMARDHDADVKEFQKEAKNAKDADLKAWVGKTLPVLEEHKQEAHQVYASVGGKDRTARRDKAPRPEGSAAPASK